MCVGGGYLRTTKRSKYVRVRQFWVERDGELAPRYYVTSSSRGSYNKAACDAKGVFTTEVEPSSEAPNSDLGFHTYAGSTFKGCARDRYADRYAVRALVEISGTVHHYRGGCLASKMRILKVEARTKAQAKAIRKYYGRQFSVVVRRTAKKRRRR